jgi:VWFA-related protein
MSVFSRLRFVMGLIATLGIVATSPRAQETSTDQSTPTIRVNTRLVLVDVVVTDKKGQPIKGLKIEDFVLEENGKKQKVAFATPPEEGKAVAPSTPPGGILSNKPEYRSAGGPLTIIVLDAANAPFRDQAYARLQMLKWTTEQGRDNQRVAVFTLTNELRVVQDFTSDPKVLAAAIQKVKPQEPILGQAAPPLISTASGADGALGLTVDMAAEAVRGFQSAQVGYALERRTLVTLSALRDLSRVLGGIPGRKNVVWLTAAFPFDLIPENRNISEAELAEAIPDVKQKSVGTIAAGSMAAEQRQLHAEEIRQAAAQLASSQIAVYPVDVRGLMSGMEFLPDDTGNRQATGTSERALVRMSDASASQETMRELAVETGGKAYVNQNEIKDGVSLAMADNKASYTLGYYPEDKKWNSKYRRIKVKVSHDDVQVRHRRGYFALDPSQIKDRKDEETVAAALRVAEPSTLVSFSAQAKPTDPGKMRVVFLVDAHSLSAEDSSGGKKMSVSFFATVFSPDGKMLTNRSIKVERAFDANTYKQILEKGMMVPIDMEVPAGGRDLRLAVLDNKTGYVGTVAGPMN